jgi:AcrR family transcriptional regulator
MTALPVEDLTMSADGTPEGGSRARTERGGPRRSVLAQDRSRDTKQAIVRAALELWSERGGVDDATAGEISERAGVAKATFYYYFAHKDDILLETGWLTAKVFHQDALKALMDGGSTDEIIASVTGRLCRRIRKVPKPALRRMLHVLLEVPGGAEDASHFGFHRGFAVIMLQGQHDGDIPTTVAPASLGLMFQSMLMMAIRTWAHEEDFGLENVLLGQFAILLAGARGVTPEAVRTLGDS